MFYFFISVFSLQLSVGQIFFSGVDRVEYETKIRKTDIAAKTKNIRNHGLGKVLETTIDKIFADFFKTGSIKKRKNKIKRSLLRKRKNYLYGISKVVEQTDIAGNLIWKAEYLIARSRLVRDIKAMLGKKTKKQKTAFYLKESPVNPNSRDLVVLLCNDRWDLSFFDKKLPPKCKKFDFCVGIILKKHKQKKTKKEINNDLKGSGYIVKYKVMRNKGKAKEFSVVSPKLDMVFSDFPTEMSTLLDLKNTKTLKVSFKTTANSSQLVRISKLLAMQEPALLGIATYRFDNKELEVEYNVAQTDNQLFKGLYFGKNLRYNIKQIKPGYYQINIEQEKLENIRDEQTP
ncbi:MAG: hypothetical protein PF689_04080 [Deltaproteobacteria bacterium]|jgi:hypothetical protein|nr:hypothetical protein [Deltaproteobacteria bacterium]